jgi:Transcription factor WhiB
MVFGRFQLGMSSSLLDEFGLDPGDFDWQDLGLCGGMPTSFFYDKYETDEEIAKATDQVCLHCPVMKKCMITGQNGEHGVWGGIYWNGAGKPDKNRNSHKTEEVWSEIKRRVA